MAIGCNFLKCKRGGMPFNYLGLPMGANMRKFSTRDPLVEKVERRLINWGNKYVSFSGRITDDRSSYIILSMFFSHFQKVLVAKGRSIRTITYDFRTFIMFSIFESVILVFPKHSNFKGFLK